MEERHDKQDHKFFYSQQNLFSIHLEDHFSIQSLIVHEEEDMAHILRLTPIIPYTYREVP